MANLGPLIFLLSAICLAHGTPNRQRRADSEISGTHSTLQFVQMVFRHGQRTPLTYFKEDPNVNATWIDPPGRLTKEGKQAVHTLGKWFRQHYDGFLSEFVYEDQVWIRSTDKDRTLKSAQLFNSGLFPPKGTEVWNDDVGKVWQPVAVHTIPKVDDPFVDDFPGKYCERAEQYFQMFVQTPEAKRWHEENLQLGQKIEAQSGKSYNDVHEFLDALDTIDVENRAQLKSPEWLSEEDVKKALALKEYYTNFYMKNDEVTRINGGYLIHEIFQRMLDVQSNKTGKLEAYVYSAHDYTIMFIMAAMKIHEDARVPFTAALILELHKVDGEYFVKTLYKNDTNSEPQVLKYSDCEELCPWNKVWEKVKVQFVEDFVKECLPMNDDELQRKKTEINQNFP